MYNQLNIRDIEDELDYQINALREFDTNGVRVGSAIRDILFSQYFDRLVSDVDALSQVVDPRTITGDFLVALSKLVIIATMDEIMAQDDRIYDDMQYLNYDIVNSAREAAINVDRMLRQDRHGPRANSYDGYNARNDRGRGRGERERPYSPASAYGSRYERDNRDSRSGGFGNNTRRPGRRGQSRAERQPVGRSPIRNGSEVNNERQRAVPRTRKSPLLKAKERRSNITVETDMGTEHLQQKPEPAPRISRPTDRDVQRTTRRREEVRQRVGNGYNPVPQHVTSAANSVEPVDLSDDPVFAKMARNAEHAALDNAERHNRHYQSLSNDETREDWLDDGTDGIVEDATDYFERVGLDTVSEMSADEIVEFAARVASNGSVNGMEIYDPIKHRGARYPMDNPFPLAIDPYTHFKEVFVQDGIIHEFVRVKVNIEDHVEGLSKEVEGKKINFAKALRNTESRLPLSDKIGKDVIETVSTSRDYTLDAVESNTFPSKAILTTGATLTDLSIQSMEQLTGSKVEGYHETRVNPILVTVEEREAIKAFFAGLIVVASFDSLSTYIAKHREKLPVLFMTTFEKHITAVFNDLLKFRVGAGVQVDNLSDDFEELRAVLEKDMSHLTVNEIMSREYGRFRRFALRDVTAFDKYAEVLPAAYLDKADSMVAITTNISTVRLPVSSEEAMGYLPTTKTEILAANTTNTPILVEFIRNLMRTSLPAFNAPADLLRIVTNDNVVFYINRGTFSDGDVFVISRETYMS